ncbi:50S ribosomal protein L15 [Candidatus Azambacteria bacterium]|nr:50S ribosomal protein L15 [Candidatus Azambacteria bacterium]MBI3685262.1 50S ribosomal protein L15 [Candidatus Azambacteria bacterium]
MQLHQFKPVHAGKDKKRIGRGGKRGTTSGRGTKGQKSRAGHRIRPAEKDMIKSLPKLRGRGKNSFKMIGKKDFPVNVGQVNAAFKDGETVSVQALLERGLIAKSGGVFPRVKLLAEGQVTKKLFIENCRMSVAAKEKIKKAGGTIKIK